MDPKIPQVMNTNLGQIKTKAVYHWRNCRLMKTYFILWLNLLQIYYNDVQSVFLIHFSYLNMAMVKFTHSCYIPFY